MAREDFLGRLSGECEGERSDDGGEGTANIGLFLPALHQRWIEQSLIVRALPRRGRDRGRDGRSHIDAELKRGKLWSGGVPGRLLDTDGVRIGSRFDRDGGGR